MNTPDVVPVHGRRLISAEQPISSLAKAIVFARLFLVWCAGHNIHGPIDWPRLYNLSKEFADFAGRRYVTKMALSKALSSLEVSKTTRYRATHERNIGIKRSQAKRPSVTVYQLPVDDRIEVTEGPVQLELFDRRCGLQGTQKGEAQG